MRPATAASPTCCAPPVLIVMLLLVNPAAPNPAPPSGKLPKYTMPASRPRRVIQFALRDGHDRPCLAPTKTLGDVALYRLWIIDPDGKEIFAGRLKSRDYR